MKWFLSALVAVGMAAAVATPAAASPPTSVFIPPPSPPVGSLVCVGGFIYQVVFVGPTGGQATLGGSPCGGGDHAIAPLTDGPNSVQFQSVRAALDLESIDFEGVDRFLEGDSDTVGGTATYFDAPAVEGQRLEGRYEKNWRPFEGQRTRAIVTIPINVIHVNGGETAVSGLVSGGLEFQLQPNWSVTPRVSVGYATGDDDFFGKDGYQGTLSVSSRYKFPQVGRGDLVIGNMAAYTAESAFDTQNLILRNGVAYQYPLKNRVGGRQASLRFSYVNTYVGGEDEPGVENIHELAFNVGIRLREQDARNRFELLRFGVLYTAADGDYDALTVTAGYRF